MSQLLPVIGVALLLFVTTNIDDIFILVTFFADPALRPRQVVIGQFLGNGALIALSLAGALLALVAPVEYIGLLGLLPLLLGTMKLVELLRGTGEPASESASPPGAHRRIIAVAMVTIANGGDNLGAYIPVFATRTPIQLAAIVLVFLVMTALWCFLGYTLVSHPRLGPPIRRIAVPLTPFVLMGIGVLILVESKTYTLLSF